MKKADSDKTIRTFDFNNAFLIQHMLIVRESQY